MKTADLSCARPAKGAASASCSAISPFSSGYGKGIQKKAQSAAAPALIHQDLDLITRAIRDFFSNDTERVVIDSPKDHRRVLDFVRHFMPRLTAKIVAYTGREPLFEQQGHPGRSQALDRRVWLRSGGSIIIERTEALTAVDVTPGGLSASAIRKRRYSRPTLRPPRRSFASSAWKRRRHHHHRFHRYGKGGQPAEKSLRRPQRIAQKRQGPDQHTENFGAGTGGK